MAKIIALLRERANGDPVVGEDVNFRNPGGTILETVASGADGSAAYEANGNPAGLVTWDATVSGETRKAGARAQRQIGAFFEAELAKSFLGVMGNGYSEGDGDECAVVPGSGRQVIVGTGCVWVQGIPFHFYADTPLASSANPGTFATRLDRVVLRVELDDSATDYGMGTLVYLEGTVNNTLPSVIQDTAGTYEYVLANVTSASGFSSYTTGNIADQRAQAGPRAVPVASLPTAIPATSIADGSVTNAEFQALNGIDTGSTIEARLDALLGLTGGTLSGLLKIAADLTSAFTVEKTNGNDVLRVSTDLATASLYLLNATDIVVFSDDGGTVKFSVDGSTGNVVVAGTLAAAGATTLSGKVTAAAEVEIDGALNHDGTTVGFFGATPVTRPTDPAAISSASISTTTWGTGEAAVVESLRTWANQIESKLRDLGLVT